MKPMNSAPNDTKKKPRKCDLNRNALYQVNPGDGAELRQACKSGDNFKHQELVDWWRSLSSSDARQLLCVLISFRNRVRPYHRNGALSTHPASPSVLSNFFPLQGPRQGKEITLRSSTCCDILFLCQLLLKSLDSLANFREKKLKRDFQMRYESSFRKRMAGQFLSEVRLLRWEFKKDASTILFLWAWLTLSSLLTQIQKIPLFQFH